MLGILSPQDFFKLISGSLRAKVLFAVLTIPGWVMPLAWLRVLGVQERIVVPLLVVGLLPFQYVVFVLWKLYEVSRSRPQQVPDELRPALEGFLERMRAVELQAKTSGTVITVDYLAAETTKIMLGDFTAHLHARLQRRSVQLPIVRIITMPNPTAARNVQQRFIAPDTRSFLDAQRRNQLYGQGLAAAR